MRDAAETLVTAIAATRHLVARPHHGLGYDVEEEHAAKRRKVSVQITCRLKSISSNTKRYVQSQDLKRLNRVLQAAVAKVRRPRVAAIPRIVLR